MRNVFVTGTDTGCGKTFVSTVLLRRAKQQGRRVVGMKPVGTEAISTTQGLRNPDALLLQYESSPGFAYSQINPYCFEPPIAPHIAAQNSGVIIQPEIIETRYRQLAAQADWVVVEGVGGWKVPLADGFEVADLPLKLDLDVVLVVGMKLGCLNHALLSAESILAKDCHLIGWVANHLDPNMVEFAKNLATLKSKLPMPLFGILPRLTVNSSLEDIDYP